jgi:HD-GYP domain-containing protein (c-di-GMP phosphodiesterase class II)
MDYLIETAKRIADILEQFEGRMEESNQASMRSAQMLKETMGQPKAALQPLREEGKKLQAEQTQSAIREALEKQALMFEQALKASLRRLEQATSQLHQERIKMAILKANVMDALEQGIDSNTGADALADVPPAPIGAPVAAPMAAIASNAETNLNADSVAEQLPGDETEKTVAVWSGQPEYVLMNNNH